MCRWSNKLVSVLCFGLVAFLVYGVIMPSKITVSAINEWLQENKPNLSLAEEDYGGNTHSDSHFLCGLCGNKFVSTVDYVKRITNCPVCFSHKHKEKVTPERIRKVADGKGVDVLSYGKSATNSRFKCRKCGYEWADTFHTFNYSTGCPMCAGNAPITEQGARDWLADNRPDMELLVYCGNVNNNSRYKCKLCGYDEWQSPFDTIKRKESKCPVCGGMGLRHRKPKQYKYPLLDM